MSSLLKISFAILISVVFVFSFAVPASAVINGGFDVNLTGGDQDTLSTNRILSVSGDSGETSGLTTGDIYDMLVSDGVSEAYALEFVLNVNETGNDTDGLTVKDLTLDINGVSFDLSDPVLVPYNKNGGQSAYEATFRTGSLGYDFLEEYKSNPDASFILSAKHSNFSDGPEVYSLNSVTVSPEPLGTTLFLLGGIPIAVSLYRKRNRAVRV
jgi:hypothetical protein